MTTISSAVSTAATTTSTTSSTSSASSSLSSSDFLSLLISELQNQDPLNATSTTDFINQLTSYANFSQQQEINSSMTSLANSFSSLVTLNSVNYIGHTVEAHHSLEVATRDNLACILASRPPRYAVNPAVLPAWIERASRGNR